MAAVRIERRKFPRKQLRLSCHLQLSTSVRVHGFTHNLSEEGAMVEVQPLPKRQQNMAPKPGDMGFVILQYHKQGAPESIKIRCRIIHIQANRIGLYLFSSKISNLDRQNLHLILETESGNI